MKTSIKTKMTGLLSTSLLFGAYAFADAQTTKTVEKNTTVKSEKPYHPHQAETMQKQTANAQPEVPKNVIHNAEKALSKAGFNIEKLDGNIDAADEVAIQNFQRKNEIPVTGRLNKETLDELDVDYEDSLEERRETMEELSE